jgi:hypothetical protein
MIYAVTHRVDLERHILRRKQMGRPVNKRHFGPLSDTTPDISIRITAKIGAGAAADGFILAQKGTRKFRVSVGGEAATCIVVDKTAGNLAAGEMIFFGNFNSNTIRIAKFYNRTCRDFAGNRYKWAVVDDSTSTYIELTAI